MNTIKEAGNYIASTVKGGSAEASKEANKSIAKDSNAAIGTRVRAAGDAISDGMNEHSHKNEAELHKQAAQH